jgi:para-nitrobenzyl esterase
VRRKLTLLTVTFVALAVSLLVQPGAAQLQNQGPVRIDTGLVSGAVTGASGSISVYKGIPYVAPPVGERRWRAPEPAAPWDGVRQAIEFSPIPPQRPSPRPQDEDSLYLNVWTPARSADERLPVMVWIYGGGFTYGSSSSAIYDGTRLAEHGVVLVSFNYRLNVLAGFAHPVLSQESGHGSGDYGMLDQIAALRWVQRNIHAFGGNPDNVTIFGESAGGLSVSALVVSPLARGLFHKAIVESGSGARLTTLAEAERAGQALAERMGVANDAQGIAALRAKPWSEFPGNTNYRGAPVLDGYAFTEHPVDAWARGGQADVPMIIGYNRDEATFFTGSQGELPKTPAAYTAELAKQFGEDADAVLALYPAKTDADAYWSAVATRTDSRFGVGARRQLRGMFSVPSKTWAYYFTFLPEASKDSPRGVSHASELRYVFGTVPDTSDEATRATSNAIMAYWTQFAKTGDPNQPGLPSWPAFERGHEAHLEIGSTIKAGMNLHKAKLDLFERVSGGGR